MVSRPFKRRKKCFSKEGKATDTGNTRETRLWRPRFVSKTRQKKIVRPAVNDSLYPAAKSSLLSSFSKEKEIFCSPSSAKNLFSLVFVPPLLGLLR